LNRAAFTGSGGREGTAKIPFIVFTVVVSILIAQIVWWIYYQVNQNKAVFQLHQSVLSIQCQRAYEEINRHYEKQLIRFTELERSHQPYHRNLRLGLPKDQIPEPLRAENFSTFYGRGDEIYYKDPTGMVISSSIDWGQLQLWIAGRYPELTVERRPQTRQEPFEYGPARVLKLPLFVRPETQFMAGLMDRTDRKTVMFISEGVFFAVMVLVGVGIMYVTLRKEVLIKAQQKNFLLSVTHELKSPLASLKLYLQTMLTKEVPAEKQRLFLRHSLHDTGRLERLVENVLEAGKIERGEYEFELQPVNLTDLIGTVLGKIEHYAEDEAVDLNTDLEPDVLVQGDPQALLSVVDNLLENAVKYSTPPKQIKLQLRKNDHRAVLQVGDNGVGIDSSDLPHIFDLFYRSGNEMTRSVKGTGVGLFIVKRIVDRHGGTVEVMSEGPNRGTTFVVSLPLIH
jgi:signal transduction histidine kinase